MAHTLTLTQSQKPATRIVDELDTSAVALRPRHDEPRPREVTTAPPSEPLGTAPRSAPDEPATDYLPRHAHLGMRTGDIRFRDDVSEKWECVAIELQGDRLIASAHSLQDVSRDEETIELPLDYFNARERGEVRIGCVFYIVVGKWTDVSNNNVEHFAHARLQRLPPIAQSRINSAAATVDELFRGLE